MSVCKCFQTEAEKLYWCKGYEVKSVESVIVRMFVVDKQNENQHFRETVGVKLNYCPICGEKIQGDSK